MDQTGINGENGGKDDNGERQKMINEIVEILRGENDEVLKAVAKFTKTVKEDGSVKQELLNFSQNGWALLLLQANPVPVAVPTPRQGPSSVRSRAGPKSKKNRMRSTNTACISLEATSGSGIYENIAPVAVPSSSSTPSDCIPIASPYSPITPTDDQRQVNQDVPQQIVEQNQINITHSSSPYSPSFQSPAGPTKPKKSRVDLNIDCAGASMEMAQMQEAVASSSSSSSMGSNSISSCVSTSINNAVGHETNLMRNNRVDLPLRSPQPVLSSLSTSVLPKSENEITMSPQTNHSSSNSGSQLNLEPSKAVMDLFVENYMRNIANVACVTNKAPSGNAASVTNRTAVSHVSSVGNIAPVSNAGSRLRHETHPLQNELILQRLFEFCPVNTLKNVRLVCTKWKDVSFDAWRRKAVLDAGKLSVDIVPDDIGDDKFQLQSKPFRRLKPVWSYLERLEEGYKDVEVGLEIEFYLGDAIHYLYTDCYRFQSTVQVMFLKHRELTHLFLYKIPYYLLLRHASSVSFESLQITPHQKLRVFEFRYDFSFDHAKVVVEEIVPFWKNIFKNLPNLEVFRFLYDGWFKDSDEIRQLKATLYVTQAIREVRAEGDFSTLKLKELSIHGRRNTCLRCFRHEVMKGIVENVKNSELPLKRLTFDIGAGTEDSILFSLLEAHAETLEYLNLIRARGNDRYLKKKSIPLNWQWLNPKLSLMQLKVLELPNGLAHGMLTLGSLHVPKLEKLIIDNWNLSVMRASSCYDKFHPYDSSCGNLAGEIDINFPLDAFLRKVELPSLVTFKYVGPKEFTPSEMKALAKSMPNLKHFGYLLKNSAIGYSKCLWPSLISYGNGENVKIYESIE